MAEYYPIIAHAISGLPSNTGEARRAVYERARKELCELLSGPELTREQFALEAAIHKVEAQSLFNSIDNEREKFTELRTLYPKLKVYIKAKAIREVYGDQLPTLDDGILGWVPGISEQLAYADDPEDEVELSLIDWNTHATPDDVRAKLHNNMRIMKSKETKLTSLPGQRLSKSTSAKINAVTEGTWDKQLFDEVRDLEPSAEASLDVKQRVNRGPVWPVLIAPLVAYVYYSTIQSGFELWMAVVFGNKDLGLFDRLEGPIWQSHWFYRLAAEVLSIGFGTFVSAGLARGREYAAAVTGGVTISLVYGLVTSISFLDPDFDPEPWYQHIIGGSLIIIAPIVGMFTSTLAQTANTQKPVGFAGINRLHFLWLAVPAHWYAIGLIWPLAILLRPPYDLISHVIKLIVIVIPTTALIIPGYHGLALLSGYSGKDLSSLKRNTLGALIIVAGGLIGLGIQFGWATLVYKVLSPLLG